MKAWIVGLKNDFYSTVVFAETRGKARSIALDTETCEDADFCDIEVKRYAKADVLYKDGKEEIDWYNDEDRIFLVKECGWGCGDFIVIEFCEHCPAKEYCGQYNEYVESEDTE